ncbi:TPA: hypothetical protein ACG3QX_003783, partial [Clostridioides difficile]
KKKLFQYLELRYAKKKKYSEEELKKYFKMLESLNIAPALIPTFHKTNWRVQLNYYIINYLI